MKKMLLAGVAAIGLIAAPAFAEDATGDWAGMLMGKLHVIIHITKAADGSFSGVLESVDQGDVKLPADAVEATPDHLKLTLKAVAGGYDGTWDATKKQWSGTWSQGGGSVPLDLHRAVSADLPAAPKRPQEEAIAKGPLPYASEDVAFTNAAANVTLKGTFSKPMGKGPFPTVVLISGSGPNTRDENAFGHKIFLILADDLNRRGIAVLRYDKRGIGGSTGDYATATTADFTSDAEAAVAWLKTRSDVDQRHIGALGHSEGGLIAPAVAVNDPAVKFVVLMAGPGLSGDEILLKQQTLIARASGVPEAAIAESQKWNRRVFDAVRASKTPDEAATAIHADLDPEVAAGHIPKAHVDAAIKQVTAPWMFYFLKSDPLPVLQKVRVPVLAVNGSLDLQVPPQEDLAAIKAALKDDKDVTVMELPGLNHLFQDAKTGSPAEYATIEETMSPVALKTVGDWIVAHTK